MLNTKSRSKKFSFTFELLKASVHMHNVSVVILHISVFVFLSFRHFCHDQQNVCSHRWSSLFSQNTSALRNSWVCWGGSYLTLFPPSSGVSNLKSKILEKENLEFIFGNTKEGCIGNFLRYVGKFTEMREAIVF